MATTQLPPDSGKASSPAEHASQSLDHGALQAAGKLVAWHQSINDALGPVFGSRGVTALMQRSVHLAAARHPFLAAADMTDPDPGFAALHALLVQQPAADISAAGAMLATTLTTLLERLVGSSLTQRLLPAVQTHPIGGPPAQNGSP